MKNYFQKILTLFTGNKYPESTQQAFYKWLVEDEHVSEKDEVLKRLWYKAYNQKSSQKEMHDSFEVLRRQAGIPSIPNERRIQPIRFWQVAAAILFFVAVSSVYLTAMLDKEDSNLLQAYIPTADVRSITLSDGSTVELNSHSTLLYPQEFNGKDRSVFLIGEANFKVKPDKKHPFIVKSNDFQVTALGTEFNVSAYPENKEITATLISGSVRVDYNNLRASVILQPNEQLSFNRSNKKHQLSEPNMEDVTAWQHGELVIREMALTDIINVLERKYPYTFIYSIKNLKTDRFSFRFKNNAPLEEVMEIIAHVVGQTDYRIEKDKCYIIRK